MADVPFLTIVTRCCRRPRMLRLNILSVLAQTCRDVEHVFLVDLAGAHRGGNVLWANRQFRRYKARMKGRYVFLLDDDGVLYSPDFVEQAKKIADAHEPDVILCRSRQPALPGVHAVLPPPFVWDVAWERGKRPARWVGHGYNSVLRSDHWAGVCDSYWSSRHGGDWRFQTDLLLRKRGALVHRLPPHVYSAMSLQRGRGEVFDPTAPRGDDRWWRVIAEEFGIEDRGRGAWRLRP